MKRSFGFTRLNNFDFSVELRYQSAIWTVYLGVYPFLESLTILLILTRGARKKFLLDGLDEAQVIGFG